MKQETFSLLITLLKDKEKQSNINPSVKSVISDARESNREDYYIIVHIFLLPHCLIYIGSVYTEILFVVSARNIEFGNAASIDLLEVIQLGLCPCDIRNSILDITND